MGYKPESYAEVLRWVDDTQIEYVPHAKKTGTKSYDRYEKYSAGKTAKEALELGSKPLDLINDFERGILKRVGGPVRDEPMNVLEIEDPTNMTTTEMALVSFGYHVAKRAAGEGNGEDEALKSKCRGAIKKVMRSKKFGVQLKDIAAGVSWAETTEMVARRSRANIEAARMLEEGRKITNDDVLRVLRLWAVKKNGDRKNVIPEGRTWVHSETVGLLQCSGGRIIATLHTRSYPKVMSLLSQYLKDNPVEGHTTDFPFSSIIINRDYAAKRHRDKLNDGPTVVVSFGEFEGGRLRYWENDDKTTPHKDLRETDPMILDIRGKPHLIDGNRAHEVEEYTGEERFSLVYFTSSAYRKTEEVAREELLQVGIKVPSEEDIKDVRGRIALPNGYGLVVTSQPKGAVTRAKRGRGLLGRMMVKARSGATASQVPQSGQIKSLFAKMIACKSKPCGQDPEVDGKAPSPKSKRTRKGKTGNLKASGSIMEKFNKAKNQKEEEKDNEKQANPATKAKRAAPAEKEEQRTPSKKPRTELAHSGSIAASTEKSRPSLSGKSPGVSSKSPSRSSKSPSKSAKALKKDFTLSEANGFLSFANLLQSLSPDAETAVAAIAESFRTMARGKDGADEIRASLNMLLPRNFVSSTTLAAAIFQAFGQPVPADMSGESLAALTIGFRAAKTSLKHLTPLTIQEVASTMAAVSSFGSDAEKVVVNALAKVLQNTQPSGMEVFFLVRALQGKLGPGQEVVHAAVARAMTE